MFYQPSNTKLRPSLRKHAQNADPTRSKVFYQPSNTTDTKYVVVVSSLWKLCLSILFFFIFFLLEYGVRITGLKGKIYAFL